MPKLFPKLMITWLQIDWIWIFAHFQAIRRVVKILTAFSKIFTGPEIIPPRTIFGQCGKILVRGPDGSWIHVWTELILKFRRIICWDNFYYWIKTKKTSKNGWRKKFQWMENIWMTVVHVCLNGHDHMFKNTVLELLLQITINLIILLKSRKLLGFSKNPT